MRKLLMKFYFDTVSMVLITRMSTFQTNQPGGNLEIYYTHIDRSA